MTLAEQARHLKSRGRHPGRGRKAGRREWRHLPPLILMTDEARHIDTEAAVCDLPRGSAVIFRHYGAKNRRALAERLARLCRRRGVKLLIAADARLAAQVGAHGVHLPEHLARRFARHRRSWGGRRPGWFLTSAAHSLAALHLAARLRADAALLSPVFATASHPRATPLGPLRFSAWARKSPLPVYALGGITAANARRLKGSGAAGIAGIGGFTGTASSNRRKVRRPV